MIKREEFTRELSAYLLGVLIGELTGQALVAANNLTDDIDNATTVEAVEAVDVTGPWE